MKTGFTLDREQIANFFRRHHITKLSLFGSVLRDDFGPDSDVDILVEFETGSRVGLIYIAGLEIELAQIIRRRVDLRTPADLSCYFREKVVATAEVQYAA